MLFGGNMKERLNNMILFGSIIYKTHPNNEKINPTNIWFIDKLDRCLAVFPQRNHCGAFVVEDFNNPIKKRISHFANSVILK